MISIKSFNVIFTIGLFAFLVAGTGCTTMQTQKDWDAKKSSAEFQKEKATFKERLGGKAPCLRTGLYEFPWIGAAGWPSNPPSKECLYPAGAYIYNRELGSIAQAQRLLKVTQVTPKGFLITTYVNTCQGRYCHDNASPNVIFVHKTDEDGIVDGAYLDEKVDGSLYEYTGTFSYETTFGSKTVHSFKKISKDAVAKAQDGLNTYNVYQEWYADMNLWNELEKSLRKKTDSK